MPNTKYPVANLTDKELQEVKTLEQKLSAAHPGQETILIAYKKG